MEKSEILDKIWELTDSMDNMLFWLKEPMRSTLPAEMHFDAISHWFEEQIQELRKLYKEETGNNPWWEIDNEE